jgi:hypothetical protein
VKWKESKKHVMEKFLVGADFLRDGFVEWWFGNHWCKVKLLFAQLLYNSLSTAEVLFHHIRYERMIINYEPGRMWEEATVAYFILIIWNL